MAEERWTIDVCPKCRKRKVATHTCSACRERLDTVEVVPLAAKEKAERENAKLRKAIDQHRRAKAGVSSKLRSKDADEWLYRVGLAPTKEEE